MPARTQTCATDGSADARLASFTMILPASRACSDVYASQSGQNKLRCATQKKRESRWGQVEMEPYIPACPPCCTSGSAPWEARDSRAAAARHQSCLWSLPLGPRTLMQLPAKSPRLAEVVP